MKPRIALVGVSGFAGVYYEDLVMRAAAGGIDLVAATVINQEAEPRKCDGLRRAGCRIYPRYEDMVEAEEGRIDLCIIPTGIHLHAPMTLAALQAGWNVLLEKPAAATMAEVGQMKAAEARSGRFVAVAYQHMYAPETMQLKRALCGGLVGEIQAIKCLGLWPRDGAYYARNDWAGRMKARGRWVLDAPFNNALAHWLNLMIFFAGEEVPRAGTPVSLEAELYRARPIESCDTACFRIGIDSGADVYFWVGHSCPRELGPVMEIRGSTGVVRWAGGQIFHRDARGERVFASCSDSPALRRHLLDAVLERLRGETVFLCDLDIAGRQTLVSSTAFEIAPIHSIEGGHLVPTPEQAGERHIGGIERDSVRAFGEERLWNELSAAWTMPSAKALIAPAAEPAPMVSLVP